MANEYWLGDQQWMAIEPLIPMNRRGVKPGRNREVIRGILPVLKYGCRWRDCPGVYGPHTTIYNRSVKGRHLVGHVASSDHHGGSRSTMHRQHFVQGAPVQRRWRRWRVVPMPRPLAAAEAACTTKIHAVADRAGRLIAFDITPGQRGDIRPATALLATLPQPDYVLVDTAYDGDKLRQSVKKRGATAVIKPNPTRKNVLVFDSAIYRLRNLIERAFSHLKDWRRVATRYDKLARNFRATVALAALIIWWA